MFLDKKENNNGIQIADLLAYPIARKIIFPEGIHLSYELIEDKIYSKNGKKYGYEIKYSSSPKVTKSMMICI